MPDRKCLDTEHTKKTEDKTEYIMHDSDKSTKSFSDASFSSNEIKPEDQSTPKMDVKSNVFKFKNEHKPSSLTSSNSSFEFKTEVSKNY